MKHDDRLSTSTAAIGKLLATWTLEGRISLEDLDHPGDNSGWISLEAERRTANSREQRNGRAPCYPPPQTWRNHAREWINANPAAWESMLRNALNAESEPPSPHLLHGL